jgi:hypothetical protein
MRSRVSLLSRCVATVGDDRNQWAAVNPTRGGSGGEGAPSTVMLWETPGTRTAQTPGLTSARGCRCSLSAALCAPRDETGD